MVAENEDIWSIPLLFQTKSDECEICGKLHDYEKCPFIEGNKEHVKDRETPSYARLTLPDGLEVKELIDGKNTVIATKAFQKGMRFGPFIAKTSALMDVRIEFPLKIFLGDDDSVYLESFEEIFCNWMCLVRPASNHQEQNLICYQLKTSIYFCTLKDIEKGDELYVWYSPFYGEKMGVQMFDKPPELVHSSDEEFKEIFASLQHGVEFQDHTYSPKLKKRRRLPRKPILGENYYQAVPSNDVLPGELLGARQRRKEWHCKHCGLLETSVAAFARHLMNHYRNLPPKTYMCPFCPKWFRKDSYVRKMHVENCRVNHEKNEANKDSVDAINSPLPSTVPASVVDSSVPCETIKPMNIVSNLSVEKDVEGHLPLEIILNVTGDFCDDGKTALPTSENTDKNVTNDVIKLNTISVCGNTTENESCPDIATDGLLDRSENQEKNSLEPENRREKNHSNCDGNEDKRNFSEPSGQSDVVGRSNWSKDGKFFESEGGNIGLESLADNLLPKSHINAPILDLSDDIDFHITKSLAEMINDHCNLEKSIYSKNNRSLDLFDSVPGTSLLTAEVTEQQTTTLGTSSFYSLEKSGFMQSSFTSCDDVTDEERNRIVENLLSETDEKFLVSDYDITDTCGSDNPTLENKKETEEKGKKKRKSETEGDFQCDICEKCFNKQIYLYRHLRKHTGEFRCNTCYMVFARKETLLTHRITCPTEAITQGAITRVRVLCKICKQQFHSLSTLNSHMEEHYCKVDTWKCACGKVSKNVELIENHSCYLNNVQVSCVHCSSNFTTALDFSNHKYNVIKRRTRRKDTSTLCEVCGMVFKSLTGIRLHRQSHGDKLFECSICGKKYARNDIMKAHMETHMEPKSECSICKKQFSCGKLLKTHHKQFHEPLNSNFTCQYCDKIFRQKGNLKKHLKVHKRDNTFPCPHCDLEFPSKKSLENHLNLHSPKGLFQCHLCEKTFQVNHALKTHIRRQHKEMYKCTYCGMNIRYRFTLRKHLSAKHRDFVDEWDTADALKAMLCTDEGEEPTYGKRWNQQRPKDILQTATDAVLRDESLHSDQSTDNEEANLNMKARKLPNIVRSSPKQAVQPDKVSEEATCLQLVTFSIGPVPENNDEPTVDEGLVSLPLTVLDNFQLVPQGGPSQPPSPSSQVLSLSLDVVPTEGLENAIVNYPFTLPEGYQLALNDDSAEKELREDNSTLVNIDEIQGTSAFVLEDGSIVQQDLQLDNNILFYIIDTSVTDSNVQSSTTDLNVL